ncbi:MAG: diaminopimelate epimerase [Bacillales bacterium]|jgi:diaminopimelate epimerase|nr:diaminopimelate epimerase [Bacillales bacterium]
MIKIPFVKMHGLGNNYIYVDTTKYELKEEILSDLAIKVSNKNTGIGSDGLILICPSDVAEVKMRIFNNDGSEGKNCGNGLRCVARYCYDNQLVNDKKFAIETLGGIVMAEVENDSVTINMGKPILQREFIPMTGDKLTKVINEELDFGEFSMKGTAVSMGNPHIVFIVDDAEVVNVEEIGSKIEKHSMFPEGVNVEFISVISESTIRFKVWERGSGITQACGTGACAATVTAILNKLVDQDKEITVRLDGGDLYIRWDNTANVWMRGPAEVICTGEYNYI